MSATPHTTPEVAPAHPGAAAYVKIAVVLAILTMTEVAVWYIFNSPATALILTILLIALSICKFTLVVMFYMHLKYDNRLFSGVFLWGLFVAISIILAVMALYVAF